MGEKANITKKDAWRGIAIEDIVRASMRATEMRTDNEQLLRDIFNARMRFLRQRPFLLHHVRNQHRDLR